MQNTSLQDAYFQYLLRLGDDALVLSHRLSEWCGHAPVLEQDIALANIALDLLGQARMLLTHAGEIEGQNRSEDDLAYFRTDRQYCNALLVEYPNRDWAYTIVRQFFFDVYHYHHYQALLQSSDPYLAAIAEKALKECTYHLRYSSEWMVRLGDGTPTSHQKMQAAVDDLWMYTGELTTPDGVDQAMLEAGIGPDFLTIKALWEEKVTDILAEATLKKPSQTWMQSGGRSGKHTEHLGYLLAEMQQLQRTYPGQVW